MTYNNSIEAMKYYTAQNAHLIVGAFTTIYVGIKLSNDGNKDVGGIVTLILIGTAILGELVKYLTKTDSSLISIIFAVLVMIYIIFIAIVYISAVIRNAIHGPVLHMKKHTIKLYKGDKPYNIKIRNSFDNAQRNMDYLIRELKECKIYGIYNEFYDSGREDIDEGLRYHLSELAKTKRQPLRLYSDEQFTIKFASEKLANEHGFKTKSVTSKLEDVIVDKKNNKKQYHIIEQEIKLNMVVMGLFPQGGGWFLFPDEYWMKHK